jgi:hypothetical protein
MHGEWYYKLVQDYHNYAVVSMDAVPLLKVISFQQGNLLRSTRSSHPLGQRLFYNPWI